MKQKGRASGILLPIFSLPSNYGIGTFGKEAYEFVDMLKRTKQQYWQILPLCPTGYGDSPYQSFSTFAGNPYFIDLHLLIVEGLLTKSECDEADFGDSHFINYQKLYCGRYLLLKKAFIRSKHRNTEDYWQYIKENAAWLKDYCLYMAVKAQFNGVSWLKWDEDIKSRQPDALQRYTQELAEEIDFHRFIQYYFMKQWKALKNYANKSGVRIVGDLPIYVAMDSADVWANPQLFQLDEHLQPKRVAGVPPDAFSSQGQLWGNPLYDWEIHKQDGYKWWIQRIRYAMRLYDTIRIDHFRGFDAYWSVPYGAENAVIGEWYQGPGADLFRQMKDELGEIDIIAEDLGSQTDSLHVLLREVGYPGMKVLQFGFQAGQDSEHLPHNYPVNSVVYTGTHDNTTLLQWYRELGANDRSFLSQYCRITGQNPCYDIIATVFQSSAHLVVIPLQDYLELGGEARINTPSTMRNNWRWRLKKGQVKEQTQEKIARLTTTYFR